MLKKNLIKMLILVLASAILNAGSQVTDGKTQEVLKNIAQYCEKLETKVFHFICNEKVREVLHKSLQYPSKRRGVKNFLSNIKSDTAPSKYPVYQHLRNSHRNRQYSPRKKERKSTYINEYQVIKIAKKLKESRKLLKFNRKKINKNLRAINNMQTRIYSYKNVLAPIHFFAKENQHKYSYKILKKERIKKSKAYVIEIKKKEDNIEPKTDLKELSNKNSGVLLLAWVDINDFSIIKFEVHPDAFKGIDYLLKKGRRKKSNVKITDIHYFAIKNGGIRYPSKTKISISYNEEPQSNIKSDRGKPNFGAIVLVKLSTTYTYKDYTFFEVSVEDPVYHNLVEE